MTPSILLYIYLAGILPAIGFVGWHNARNGVRDDVPGIFTGLAWPLLFVVLCLIVPAVTAIGWLFEQPARFGAWLATTRDSH